MSKFIGRRVNVGIAKESSRGVGVAAAFTIPKTNYTFDDKANKARSGEQLGNIAGNGSQSIVTGRFAEGALEGEVNANSFGLLLLALFGTDTPSAYATGAYKHTFTLANTNQHQSLSIHCEDPIGDVIFENAMIDNLSIDVNENEIVKFTAGLKSKKGQSDTYTPAFAADYKFVGRDMEFKVAATQGDLAAASAVSIKSLKLTVNKNVDFDWVLGTLEPEDVLNKQIVIQGQLTLNYEDRTWRDYMLNGDYKAIGIKLTNSRAEIGTAGTPILYFEFPVVDFSEWESQRGNDEIAGQTINFTVLYDIANSRLVSEVSITNTTASY